MLYQKCSPSRVFVTKGHLLVADVVSEGLTGWGIHHKGCLA